MPCQCTIVASGRLLVSLASIVSPTFASIAGPGTSPLYANPGMLRPGANSHPTSFAPSSFPLPSRAGLAPARRAREQCLRRDFAENELVVAKQRRRDRGDRPSSVEWCQVPLLDGALNLLDEPLRDLPFRLDRGRKV